MSDRAIYMGRHLDQTADIARRDHPHPKGFKAPRLAFAELSGQLRLEQVIGARRATTEMGLAGLNDIESGGFQKRHRLIDNFLTVTQGTGGQITDL